MTVDSHQNQRQDIDPRPRSQCCGAPIDFRSPPYFPLCVRCNGLLNHAFLPYAGRHAAGHNDRCGLGPAIPKCPVADDLVTIPAGEVHHGNFEGFAFSVHGPATLYKGRYIGVESGGSHYTLDVSKWGSAMGHVSARPNPSACRHCHVKPIHGWQEEPRTYYVLCESFTCTVRPHVFGPLEACLAQWERAHGQPGLLERAKRIKEETGEYPPIFGEPFTGMSTENIKAIAPKLIEGAK